MGKIYARIYSRISDFSQSNRILFKTKYYSKKFQIFKKFKSASYQISAFIMSATPHNGHLEIPYYLKVFIGGNFKTTAVKYY